jgi:hypothetical protein
VPARDEDAQPWAPCDPALDVEDVPSQAAARSAAKEPLEFELSPDPPGGVQAETLLRRARSRYSASRRRPRETRFTNT